MVQSDMDASPPIIAGLPWTAWLLWFVAVALPLAIELRFFFNQRRRSKPSAKES
jgi:hypothetical protein